MTGLPRSARRVAAALEAAGLDAEVRVLPDSARTAPEAAVAVRCDVDQIVKSLVFRGATSGRPLLVLVRGGARVDEAALARQAGEPVGRADAAWVREATGFAIGGVPPLGHARPLTTLMDPGLLAFDVVWAAAGTPHAVFPIEPERLREAAGADLLAVAE